MSESNLTHPPRLPLFIAAAVSVVAFSLAACGKGQVQGSQAGTVCGALGTSASSSLGANFGLKAKLYSLPHNLSPSTPVAQAQASGTVISDSVYLSQVNVPPRRFDEGFLSQSGTSVQSSDGSKLAAYFSFHMESQVMLGGTDAQGGYQFGLYSDDGSVLQINTGAGYRTIVNNDGAHESKLAISSEPVTLRAGEKLPLILDYMQGEPDFLSVVLLWRPWPAGGAGDPAEGVVNPHAFWDITHSPSMPLQPWNDLLSRGWRVVGPQNFWLSAPNPCQ
jgi:hypothetical protein